MRYDPDKHHRRSIRLKGYDYSQQGAYFVTLCAQNREPLFGEIVGEELRLNDAGRMVGEEWLRLADEFPFIETDECVVMPNHFHGILVIVRGDDVVGANLVFAPDPVFAHDSIAREQGDHKDRPNQRPVGANLVFARDPVFAHDSIAGEEGDHKDRPNEGPNDHPNDHPNADGPKRRRPFGTIPGTLGRVVQAFKSRTTHEYVMGVRNHAWPPFPGRLWQRNYYEHIIRNESDLNRIRDYIETNPLRWALDQLNPANPSKW